ncbi:Ig-like domain-containing protein [Bacillus sp. EB600]|uniref:Ig-like domain-containing protein n=1 Tax=Bacillus sp. EB600 TaxID=2806345 RepID=UPI00210889FA|nr:Ig-like domain-containing protein [Bacillus sp. EB600]MCQ6278712.1 cytochrome c3 family protein [Bacillus sp. EB600]
MKVTAPNDGSVFDVSTVTFTGTISDDITTPDNLSLKVLETQNGSPVDITSKGVLSVSPAGDFSYSSVFSQGTHTLTFRVTDESGQNSDLTWTFTVNYVKEMNLIKDINDTSSFLSVNNMTEVRLDEEIRLVLNDDGTVQTSDPELKIKSSNGKDVSVKEKLIETNSQDNSLVYTFTPSSKLDPRTTYYVYLNQSDVNVSTTPSIFKFTTMSDTDPFLTYKFENDSTNYSDPENARQPDRIHGYYSNTTNACNYCHNTHNGKNAQLEGGKYGDTYSNLCMACHDGTVASQVDTNSSNHQSADPTKFNESSSCASCHESHLGWTKENPNLLKSN